MAMGRKATGKIDATPEEVAQAIFAAARPPDPTKRKQRGQPSTGQSEVDEVSYMRKSPKPGKEWKDGEQEK